MSNTIIDTNFNFPGQKSVYKGKVREVYYINDDLLVMIATDRLSAFDVVMPKGIPACVTRLLARTLSAGAISPLGPRPLTLPPRAKSEPPDPIKSRSDSVSAVDLSSSISRLNRVLLPIRVNVASNSLLPKPPSSGCACSISVAKDAKLSLRMKLMTRWSGRKPYFNATSSGKI